MFVRSFGSVVGLAVMGALVNNATGHGGGATNQALTPRPSTTSRPRRCSTSR